MKRHFAFFVLLIVTACTPKPLEIEGFSSETWKADKRGCQGERAALFELIYQNREQFIGASEPEIKFWFGEPEKVELSRRNEKWYYYFIENGSQCKSGKREGKKLEIRFNSITQVKELNRSF